jgi:hypothetical protein
VKAPLHNLRGAKSILSLYILCTGFGQALPMFRGWPHSLFGLTRYNCLDYELKISLSHPISLVCFAKKSFDRRRYFLQYGLAYKMYFASWKNKANPPNRTLKHVTKWIRKQKIYPNLPLEKRPPTLLVTAAPASKGKRSSTTYSHTYMQRVINTYFYARLQCTVEFTIAQNHISSLM